MKNGFKITRDEKRCIACYECLIVCPQSGEGKAHPVFVYPKEKGGLPELNCLSSCIQCMTCWDICRAHAIHFENHHQVARLVEDESILARVAKII